MKERPILFSTEMVKAILDGRKTMTRRAIKARNESGLFQVGKKIDTGEVVSIWEINEDEEWEYDMSCPYGYEGDILWVKETFRVINHSGYASPYWYKADACYHDLIDKQIKWKPSLFLPKVAARIFLKIKSVFIERLQDISDGHVVKEGVTWNEPLQIGRDQRNCKSPAQRAFRNIWDKINGEKSWDENPFVWVIEFEKIDNKANLIGKNNIHFDHWNNNPERFTNYPDE